METMSYERFLFLRLGMDGTGTYIRRPTTAASGIYSGGSNTAIKTAYNARPTYTYTPIATTPISGTTAAGRYTPITRQPSPSASVGREREIPVIREQKVTETFKATGRVGPRTDW